MEKFRVFVQDVGRSGYSALLDVVAVDPVAAAKQFVNRPGILPGRYVVVPHFCRDVWPDGKTGKLPPDPQKWRTRVTIKGAK